jgi:hypothetical protein
MFARFSGFMQPRVTEKNGSDNSHRQRWIAYFSITVDWLAAHIQPARCLIQVSVNLPRRE